jgi:hypothetical protein
MTNVRAFEQFALSHEPDSASQQSVNEGRAEWFCRFFLGGDFSHVEEIGDMSDSLSDKSDAEFIQRMTQFVMQNPEFDSATHLVGNLMLDGLFRKRAAKLADRPLAPLLPNCFVIGQARTGTTSLHQYFLDHPDVYAPAAKETNYYSHWSQAAFGENGMSKQDYAMYFMDAAGESVRADVSPFYISEPGVALRIFRDCPNAKIVAILRNPVDLLVSKYNLDFGAYGSQSDIDAWCLRGLRDFRASEPRWDYDNPASNVHHCLVAQPLAEYCRLFRGKVKIFLFDDVARDQESVYAELCDFLDIRFIYERPYWLARSPKSARPSDRVRRQLDEFFAPEIERLAEVAGRDLGAWRPDGARVTPLAPRNAGGSAAVEGRSPQV